jgi:hypothetical protein
MQSRLRLNLATRVALLSIFLGSPVAASPQSSADQPTAALPKPWNDAVAQLADKIAASVSPSTPVTLDVKNISSLDASYTSAIGLALRNELQRHSLHLTSAVSTAPPSAVQLQLTLSESTDQFVWVVQNLGNTSDAKSNPVTIVSVSKIDLADGKSDEPFLLLEKRLVWKQPENFLDFALFKNSDSSDPALLVLETNRLALYKMSGSEWKISRTSPIPQASPASRDPQGNINVNEGYVSTAGQKCAGDPDLSGTLHCNLFKPSNPPIHTAIAVMIPGLPGTGTTPLSEACGANKIVFLASGEGDWTKSDFVQGYLERTLPEPVVPSGKPIEFDGPVMALRFDTDPISARAVVHNLKTGNYEAYIVSATCSH